MGDNPRTRFLRTARRKAEAGGVHGSPGIHQVSIMDYIDAPEVVINPAPTEGLPTATPTASQNWRDELRDAKQQLREATAARRKAERAYDEDRREFARLYKQQEQDDREETRQAFRNSKELMDTQRAEVRRQAKEARELCTFLREQLSRVRERIRHAKESGSDYEIPFLMDELRVYQPQLSEAASEGTACRMELKHIAKDLKMLSEAKHLDEEDCRAYAKEERELDKQQREFDAELRRWEHINPSGLKR